MGQIRVDKTLGLLKGKLLSPMRKDVQRHYPRYISCFKTTPKPVPSRPRALTKSQSQHVVGPLVGPKEESQQIDRLRHRRVSASPIEGVA